MQVTETLSALVREKWSSLLGQDFEVTDEDTHRVVLKSPAVQVVTIHEPRGEVDVFVSPRNREWPQRWSYAGMVGRASVGRLLELALVEMTAEPAILAGDFYFYERLARDNEASSLAWNEFYAGRGPQPRNKRLP